MIFIRIFGDVRKSSTHVLSSFSSFFLFDITNVNQVYLPSILVKQAKRRNRKILFASSNNLLHRCQFERKNAIESTKKEQKMKRRERSAFKFLYYRSIQRCALLRYLSLYRSLRLTLTLTSDSSARREFQLVDRPKPAYAM